jgi:hypothetical protein
VSDDRELPDRIHQLFAKTTGGDDTFWQTKDEFSATCVVCTQVEDGDTGAYIATDMSAADAEFVAAVHGAWPTLWRMLNEAWDEAERADLGRDGRECQIAELELEIQGLKAALAEAAR